MKKLIFSLCFAAALLGLLLTLSTPVRELMMRGFSRSGRVELSADDLPSAAVEMPRRAFCSAGHTGFDEPFAGGYWNGWGADLNNHRSQSGAMAGLQADSFAQLKLKWAFGVPGVKGMYGQPTAAGGRLFFGTSTGNVYSIDAASACVYWVFKASANVRTAITVGRAGARWAAYFGDTGANGAHAYAVDADTGSLIWKTTVDESPLSRISGSPALYSGVLYVPVTSSEDAKAGDPAFECCRLQGSLAALNAGSGEVIWKSPTIPAPARPVGRNSRNVQQWGPSGAGIWSAPTVDPLKGAIYVATGDSHSVPEASTSDAILAFDMATGRMLWSRQAAPGDLFNMACVDGDPANCPQPHGNDLDFGSPPVLVGLQDGRRALIAGQKSGIVYAFDPDNEGKLLWHAEIGKGGPLGGVMFGLATDEQNAYVALSDMDDVFGVNGAEPFLSRMSIKFVHLWHRTTAGFLRDGGGGTFALRLNSGQRVWYAPPQCDSGPGQCHPAQLAAVTHIPGVVLSGSADGYLRAYSTDDGHVIWKTDTARRYETANGIGAHGGAICGPGPTVAGGVIYVNSGYPGPRETPGNVLLAYSVGGK